MSEKCRNNNNNNSDSPLTSRRTDGGKNAEIDDQRVILKTNVKNVL